MPAVPKYDSIFAYDAASVPDDETILSGPVNAPAPVPDGSTPWNGPYGHPVTDWSAALGYPGYGAPTQPNRSWKFDVALPDGWYTRRSRRDKHSS